MQMVSSKVDTIVKLCPECKNYSAYNNEVKRRFFEEQDIIEEAVDFKTLPTGFLFNQDTNELIPVYPRSDDFMARRRMERTAEVMSRLFGGAPAVMPHDEDNVIRFKQPETRPNV